MRSINFLLIIAAFLFTCNTGFAQSSKSDGKAVEKTNELDEQLKSKNPALALTESQKEQIVLLQMERTNEISAFRKSNPEKKAVKAKSKALKKAMNAKINSEILTAEQAEAQKDNPPKMKGQKGKGAEAGKKAKRPAVAAITVAEADKIYAAANAKQKAKAEKLTEKLNTKIIASDASLALSPDQIKQINALNIKGLLERTKMEKKGATKEEIKKVSKSNNRAIKGILTKEQHAASKASKSK